MARLSEYDFLMCEEICLQVADGLNIKAVLKQKNSYPDFSTWCRWKREHKELYNLYINSIQDKAESLDNELDELKEMLLSKEIDPSTYNTLAQTIKWKMAKFYPKMFGDKQQIDHTTDGQTINQPPKIIFEAPKNE
jgi:hypothetical protein